MSYELGIVLVAGIALASGAAVVASVALLVRLLRFLDTGRDPEEPGSSGWGSGGGGATPPERPEPPGGASDPAWWPAFERQFAEYVASFSECGVGRARRTTAAAIVGARRGRPPAVR